MTRPRRRRASSAPSTPSTSRSATSATSSSGCGRSSLERRDLLAGLAALAEEFRRNSMIDVELDATRRSSRTRRDRHGTPAPAWRARRSATSPATRARRGPIVSRRARPATDLRLRIDDDGHGLRPGHGRAARPPGPRPTCARGRGRRCARSTSTAMPGRRRGLVSRRRPRQRRGPTRSEADRTDADDRRHRDAR